MSLFAVDGHDQCALSFRGAREGNPLADISFIVVFNEPLKSIHQELEEETLLLPIGDYHHRVFSANTRDQAVPPTLADATFMGDADFCIPVYDREDSFSKRRK